jgi:hypothetical protein
MKTTTKIICVHVCLLIFLTSCGGEPRPKDMPALHSTTVTITQDGSPLADAVVTFVSGDSSTSKWAVGGRTDSQGVCNVKTQGTFAGAPVGKYKVCVTKIEETESQTEKGPKPDPNDMDALNKYHAQVAAEKKSFDVVDEKYKLAVTSDLEIEVVAGSNNQKFDVGKAIKKEIKLVQ